MIRNGGRTMSSDKENEKLELNRNRNSVLPVPGYTGRSSSSAYGVITSIVLMILLIIGIIVFFR